MEKRKLHATIQLRGGDRTEWNSKNPVLDNFEAAILRQGDEYEFKVGDGVSTFTELPNLLAKEELMFDTVPTENSTNFLNSGSVFNALLEKANVSALEGLVTETWVEEKLAQLPLKDYVDEQIATRTTESFVTEKIDELNENIDSKLENLASKSYVQNSLVGVATESYVDGEIIEVEGKIPDVSGFIPSSEKGIGNGVCSLNSSGVVPSSQLGNAQTSEKGAVFIATDAEALLGTDTSKVITPHTLKSYVDNALDGIAEALDSINGEVV